MFKINDTEFPCPNQYLMSREDNIVASFTTLSGKSIGDVRGWKYANNVLLWSYLTPEQLQDLITATAQPFTVSFEDLDGQKTVNAIRLTIGGGRVFRFVNGEPSFTDISLGVSYPDVYND